MTNPGAGLSKGPDLVLLDVNETLSDLSGMQEVFTEVGLETAEVPAWFAGVLRDGFALALVGENPSFADIATGSVEMRLSMAGHGDPGAAAARVMDRFVHLSPHPDVVPGLLALARTGSRIATLSNGSASVAEALLGATDAGGVVERYLSVEAAGTWKPARRAYTYALDELSVPAARAMLVAVHPWDIEGARRAGLSTAFLRRGGAVYPSHLQPADHEVTSIVELAEVLAAR